MERKAQQRTLSIRVPESLRNYLERAKALLSDNVNESVSTSDAAKFLLESARDDRLDDRIEVADLRTCPMEALLAIRQKWEQNHYLSLAEFIFLAQYAQVGCEGLTGDLAMPGSESLACVLEAFLAVCGLCELTAALNWTGTIWGTWGAWVLRYSRNGRLIPMPSRKPLGN